MAFIPFTDEEKELAWRTDLPRYLESNGFKIKREGSQYRYYYTDYAGEHDSITVFGNQWYDHKNEEGGGPLSFCKKVLGLNYKEAMLSLLGRSEASWVHASAAKVQEERKPFAVPPLDDNVRKSRAYLCNDRHLDWRIVGDFIRQGLIKQSLEYVEKVDRTFKNTLFMGYDAEGVPQHVHQRSATTYGKTFRINVQGSNPCCSFHHIGAGDRLYVFEAPIDLLSFLTLYPKNWQQHSYVALCGTATQAVDWILETYPQVEKVVLCLDHDAAGIEASEKCLEELLERGVPAQVLQSQYKDWNEDVKAKLGLSAQPAEEHPMYRHAPAVFEAMQGIPVSSDDAANAAARLRWHSQQLRHHHRSEDGAAVDGTARRIGALALAASARHRTQMGQPTDAAQLAARLRDGFRAHKNRGRIQRRVDELAQSCTDAIVLMANYTIKGQGDKESIVAALDRVAYKSAGLLLTGAVERQAAAEAKARAEQEGSRQAGDAAGGEQEEPPWQELASGMT